MPLSTNVFLVSMVPLTFGEHLWENVVMLFPSLVRARLHHNLFFILLYLYSSELQASGVLGELMISLGYLRLTERLTIVVIRARNLPINEDKEDPGK